MSMKILPMPWSLFMCLVTMLWVPCRSGGRVSKMMCMRSLAMRSHMVRLPMMVLMMSKAWAGRAKVCMSILQGEGLEHGGVVVAAHVVVVVLGVLLMHVVALLDVVEHGVLVVVLGVVMREVVVVVLGVVMHYVVIVVLGVVFHHVHA